MDLEESYCNTCGDFVLSKQEIDLGLCYVCVTKKIKQATKNYQIIKHLFYSCLDLGCSHQGQLSRELVKKCVDNEQFLNKYQLLAPFEYNSKKRYLLCQCNSILHYYPDWEIAHCKFCRRNTCISCRKQHRGTCRSVKSKKENEDPFYLDPQTEIECPVCKHTTTKNQYEKNQHCKFCTFYFCSICLGSSIEKCIHSCFCEWKTD